MIPCIFSRYALLSAPRGLWGPAPTPAAPFRANESPDTPGPDWKMKLHALMSTEKRTMVLTEFFGGKLAEIHISGRLSRQDHEELVPELERLIRLHGRIRILVQLHHFTGWTFGALWEELNFDSRSVSPRRRECWREFPESASKIWVDASLLTAIPPSRTVRIALSSCESAGSLIT